MPVCRAILVPLMVATLSCSTVSHAAEPASIRFPTFGISYRAPADSTFTLSDVPTHIGLYEMKSAATERPAAILLEVAPARGKSLDDIAVALAKKIGATIDPKAITIGNEKAKKLTADVKLDSYVARVSYVVVHENRLYIASALNTATGSADKQLDDLVATIKFIPVESPAKQTGDLFAEPLDVFDAFTINGPKYLRRNTNQSALVHLSAYDFTTGTDPLNIDIEHIQMSAPKKFADIRDAYSTQLAKTLKSSKPLEWSNVKEVPGLNVSRPVVTTVKLAGKPDEKSTRQFCILELAPGDFVQILFSISDVPDADLQAYQEACDKMLRSIKLLDKSKDPH